MVFMKKLFLFLTIFLIISNYSFTQDFIQEKWKFVNNPWIELFEFKDNQLTVVNYIENDIYGYALFTIQKIDKNACIIDLHCIDANGGLEPLKNTIKWFLKYKIVGENLISFQLDKNRDLKNTLFAYQYKKEEDIEMDTSELKCTGELTFDSRLFRNYPLYNNVVISYNTLGGFLNDYEESFMYYKKAMRKQNLIQKLQIGQIILAGSSILFYSLGFLSSNPDNANQNFLIGGVSTGGMVICSLSIIINGSSRNKNFINAINIYSMKINE